MTLPELAALAVAVGAIIKTFFDRADVDRRLTAAETKIEALRTDTDSNGRSIRSLEASPPSRSSRPR